MERIDTIVFYPFNSGKICTHLSSECSKFIQEQNSVNAEAYSTFGRRIITKTLSQILAVAALIRATLSGLPTNLDSIETAAATNRKRII